MKELNTYSTQLIRELIIPKLTKEVNTSKRYASLRQVFFSLVMARWFKERFKGLSPKGTVPFLKLIDSGDLTNLTSKESWSKSYYFNEYKKSFEKGEYNLKEQVYTPTCQVIRSYVSGGVSPMADSPLKGGYLGKKDSNLLMEGIISGNIKISGSAGSSSLTQEEEKNITEEFKAKIGENIKNYQERIETLWNEAGIKVTYRETYLPFLSQIRSLLKEVNDDFEKNKEPILTLRSFHDWFFVSIIKKLKKIPSLVIGSSVQAGVGIVLSGTYNEAVDKYRKKVMSIDRDYFIKNSNILKSLLEEENKNASIVGRWKNYLNLKVLNFAISGMEKIQKQSERSGYGTKFGSSPLNVEKAKEKILLLITEFYRNVNNLYEATEDGINTHLQRYGWNTQDELRKTINDFKNLFERNNNSIVSPKGLEAFIKKNFIPKMKKLQKSFKLNIQAIKLLDLGVEEYITFDNVHGPHEYYQSLYKNLEEYAKEADKFIVKITNLREKLKSSSSLNVEEGASSALKKEVGGIDFRSMQMLIQPMGSFSDLNLSLPTLSSSALERIDLDQELAALRNLVKAGKVPSGARVKEYLAAVFQKGRMEEKQDDLLVCLAEIYRLAEEEVLETSPELRESLVMVDTGRFILLPNNRRAGLN